MTDTTHGRPIEPTDVKLSTERTDNGTTPPPPPPPAGPPAAPPPPRGGGGVAVADPAPASAVHHHHYYPAQPAQERPPRFSVSRLSPLRNGTALVAGLVLLPVTGKVLHVFGDEPGVLMAALAVAGLLELRSNPYNRLRSWLVRVLTCNIVASCFVTPAGLYLLGYLFTGVWS